LIDVKPDGNVKVDGYGDMIMLGSYSFTIRPS